MFKKPRKRSITALLLAVALLATACLLPGCGKSSSLDKLLDPKNTISLEIWTYYNGPQKMAFDALVDEFNETVGQEKGIVVETFSQGTVDELLQKVLDAANKKVGAGDIPNIFAAYADTAYQVDQLGLVASLDDYFTEEELAAYVPAYIEEGRFDAGETLKIFPTAKSTEVMMVNKTDWDRFAQATGASLDSLQTIEGVVKTAKQYYEWTDSQTPAPDDGKAFYGRDAMANYFVIGCKQLGEEIFAVQDGEVTLHCEEATIRRLWDNYYLPLVNGYFAANGRFRSDDAKVGDIIAALGSTSGAAYFPDQVTLNDTQSYPIEAIALRPPVFEGAEPYAVQQGAGMVVSKSDRATEYACAVFLKWFTEAERNVGFSIESGYLPVKTEANSVELLEQALQTMPDSTVTHNLRVSLPTSAEMVASTPLYTTKAFHNGSQARQVLENALADQVEQDCAAIQAKVEQGESRAAAAAAFTTDEHFQLWYQSFRQSLVALTTTP